MTTSTSVKMSGRLQAVVLHAAFAILAIAAFSVRAHAADLDQITVQGSTTKTVGRDYATNAPIQETSVQVAVSFDPATLTTDSGVKRLKQSVVDAARQACDSADPFTDDDGTCMREAIDSAQAQIAKVVSQARSNTNG
jgi:UrcA family protein